MISRVFLPLLTPTAACKVLAWRLSLKLAVLQTILVLVFIYLVIHRILGFVAGLILRYFLCGSLFSYDGRFDVHFGWISYRGIFDRNQLVIGQILWRNPPGYTETPYILRCHEISVTYDPFALIDLILTGKVLKFDQVIIDTLEVFFEKAPKNRLAKGSLNVWAAFGIYEKDDENNYLSAFFHFIVFKLRQKIELPNPLARRDGEEEEDENDDEEETGPVTNTEATGGHERLPSTDITNEQSHSQSQSQTHHQKNTPLKVDINRLLVLDLIAHPLDLLNDVHIPPSKTSDIRMKCFTLCRKDVTGPPLVPGGERVALIGDKFGDKFGEKFAADMFAENR